MKHRASSVTDSKQTRFSIFFFFFFFFFSFTWMSAQELYKKYHVTNCLLRRANGERQTREMWSRGIIPIRAWFVFNPLTNQISRRRPPCHVSDNLSRDWPVVCFGRDYPTCNKLCRAPCRAGRESGSFTSTKTSFQNIASRFCISFAIIEICLIWKIMANCPRTTLLSTVLKQGKRKKTLTSRAHVLEET